MKPLIDRGIDLLDPEVMTDREHAAFRNHYVSIKGKALPSFEFWAEFRPDVLKRKRLMALMTPAVGPSAALELPHLLSFLHHYALVGYGHGVVYQINNAWSHGASRDHIVETLSVAQFHSGSQGLNVAAAAAHQHLRAYADPDTAAKWPAGWAVDAAAFQSGLDFRVLDLSSRELATLEGWYERVCGEVPPYVRLLARHRPRLLKAYRNRFENTIRVALPKQMMPYIQLQWNVSRACAPGIREALLLARGFGMTRDEVMNAIAWGVEYGGVAAASLAEKTVGDILGSWP